MILADRHDDLGVRIQLTCGEGGQHAGVVATGGDDDLGRLRHPCPAQHVGSGGIAEDTDQAQLVGFGYRGRRRVDDDDPLGLDPVGEQRRNGAAPLDAVSHDDRVIPHSLPPAVEPQLLASP
jgi:hypothetical protein